MFLLRKKWKNRLVVSKLGGGNSSIFWNVHPGKIGERWTQFDEFFFVVRWVGSSTNQKDSFTPRSLEKKSSDSLDMFQRDDLSHSKPPWLYNPEPKKPGCLGVFFGGILILPQFGGGLFNKPLPSRKLIKHPPWMKIRISSWKSGFANVMLVFRSVSVRIPGVLLDRFHLWDRHHPKSHLKELGGMDTQNWWGFSFKTVSVGFKRGYVISKKVFVGFKCGYAISMLNFWGKKNYYTTFWKVTIPKGFFFIDSYHHWY